MLHRIQDYYSYFGISESERASLTGVAKFYSLIANNMTHLNDYNALATISHRLQPKKLIIWNRGVFGGSND